MVFFKVVLGLSAVMVLTSAYPTGHGHAESYASFNLLHSGYHHGGDSGLGGLGGGAGAGGEGHGHHYHHEEYHHSHPKYDFKYGVEDHHTGDHKEQKEERDHDVVKGHYSLLQPDGRKRIVHYTASKHGGFNAIVSYSGHAIHPQVHHEHGHF